VRPLQKELGVSPSETTLDLYRQIQGSSTSRRDLSPESCLSALGGRIGALPLPLTPFLGREAEREQCVAWLRDQPACRLLTLVGLPGLGKTRLALQVAQDVAASLADGVAWLGLDAAFSSNLLVSLREDVLRFTWGQPGAQWLSYLHDKTMLRVLDNLESGLKGGCWVTTLLQAAPGLKVLVTGPARLNLHGEWLVRLGGLEVPEQGVASVDQAAVQLFLQAARRIQGDFCPSEADLAWIPRLCGWVGGMPLGIELAASWVRLLTCQQIARRVEQSLDLLSTSLCDVPARQRSLRAVFDHAWRLLPVAEQRVFRATTVFEGGFRFEAALAALQAEQGNLRRAWQWAVTHGREAEVEQIWAGWPGWASWLWPGTNGHARVDDWKRLTV
jgi:predicted ATPase